MGTGRSHFLTTPNTPRGPSPFLSVLTLIRRWRNIIFPPYLRPHWNQPHILMLQCKMKVWKLVFLRTWGQKRNTISFQTCQIWRGTNENSKRASRNTLHLPGIVHRAIQENWRNGKTDITSLKTISDVPYEHLKTRYNLRMKQTRNNIKWATQECVQGQWRSWGGIRCQEGAARVIVKIAHAAISFRNAPRQKIKKIKINIQAFQLLLFVFPFSIFLSYSIIEIWSVDMKWKEKRTKAIRNLRIRNLRPWKAVAF